MQVICILPKSIGLVTLDTDLSLESDTFLLSSTNLVPDCSNLSLVLIVRSILLVEKETKVFNLLSESVTSYHVRIVSVVVVVILHQLFILQMSILLLDSIQLIPKRDVVFIALLNLEDLCLKLRNQKILLITSEVHRVVVLETVKYRLNDPLTLQNIMNSQQIEQLNQNKSRKNERRYLSERS